MLNQKSNVGKMTNEVLMKLIAYFQNGRQKSWILTSHYEIFYFLTMFFFIQNLFVCLVLNDASTLVGH